MFLVILPNMYRNSSERFGFHPAKEPLYPFPISSANIKNIYSECSDFEIRKINVGLEGQVFVHVCWIDGLVSGTSVADFILKPLTEILRNAKAGSEKDCIRLFFQGSIYSYSVRARSTTDDVISDLSHGLCSILFDKENLALSFEVRSTFVRSISEPTLEKSLKGAKDSFIEILRINTSLVRKRICSPDLKLIETNLGRKSRSNISIMYVEGIANNELVQNLQDRLKQIDVDAVLSVGILEEKLVDHPLSPFPQLIHTERPDRFAMYLMDGRVGLLIDGLPVGLVLPVSFAEFMKVTGDSNMHFLVSTSLTLLRYLALVLSVLLPAVYVSVSMYHQEMIPTKLLQSIIDAKQNVPFSTAIEIISLMLAFGFLQEAGLRLPNPIGDTVSIIGALIVGQSAVEAQLVSPIAIIVVAVSGIAGYTLPSQDLASALRLLRFVLLLSAIAAGLYGVGLVSCLVLLHLASIDNFGFNYTAPLSDRHGGGLFRLLIRLPKSMNKFRDPLLRGYDRRRQK